MFASFAEADAHLRARPLYRRSAIDVLAQIPSAEARAALLAIATANQLTRVHELTRRGDELFGRPGLEPHRALLLDALARFARRAPSVSPPSGSDSVRQTLVDLGAEGLLRVSARDLAHVARDERKHALLAHCYGTEDRPLETLLPPTGRLTAGAAKELVDLAVHLVRERRAAGAPAGPPAVPELAELHRLLAERRAALSAEVWPLPMPRTLADLPLEHSHDPIEPQVFLRLPNFCRVELVFAPGALELRCGEHRRPCFHHVHLLDRILAALRDPQPSEDWRRLAELARIPPWERVLRRLEGEAALDRARAILDARPAFILDESPEGRLRVHAGIRRRHRRTGEWLSPQPRPPNDVLAELDVLLGSDERRALELLHLGSVGRAPLLLHTLVGLDHVYLAGPDGELAEVRVERHPPRVTLALDGAGAVELRAGGVALVRPELGYAIAPERDRIVITDVPRRLSQAAADLGRVLPLVPAAERPRLVEACLALGPTHAIELEDTRADVVTPAEEWVVRLTSAGATLRIEHLVRPISGGPLHPAAAGLERVFAARPDGTLLETRRDLEREAQLLAARWTDWLGEPHATPELEISDPEAALGFLARLRDEPRGATVEWASRPWTLRRATGRFVVQVSALEDRFGLKGALEVDGTRIALAVLLDLVRRQSGYVRLDDDTWVELDESLRQRLRTLAAHVRTRRGELEVSPHSVPTIEAALGEVGPARPPRWDAVLARARAAEGLEPRVPKDLRAELRPYQVEGYRWLARLAELGAGAVLADDMGLGKTVQTLALLTRRRRLGPALVVAPTSVTFNWVRELARFAPSLEVVRLAGRSRDLDGIGPGSVVVVSYALLVNELPRLAALRFATVVLDEAQAIKNADTRRARAARELQAEFVVALTGTPVENHVGELWSIFAAVLPGLLGSKSDFDARFADGRDLELLADLVRPFVLRRTKAAVLGELPPKTEMREDVMLSPEERQIYDESKIALAARLRGLGGRLGPTDRIVVLAAITQLRQLACDVGLVTERAAPSSKLLRMGELAESLVEEGHHVLVFSQFVRLLDRAERVLAERGLEVHRLDGSTPAERRGEIVDAFQRSRPSVLLVSLKAGGTGLNLTTADHVLLLDPWWNPAVEDQAADRAHRIGQTRPVTVLRLVSRDTIEDAVLAMHGEKRAVAEALFGGASGVEKLSATELFALVAGEAPVEPEDGGPSEPRADPAPAPPAVAPPPAPDASPPPARRSRRRRPTEPTVAALAEGLAPELDGLSPATARLYGRVLGRVVELVGEEPAGPALGRLGAIYAQAVAAGRFAKSDLPIVNALTGRLLDRLGARPDRVTARSRP